MFNRVRFSVSYRILLVVVLGMATPAIVSLHALLAFRAALIDARASEVRHLDQVAYDVVASFHEAAVAGRMTEAAAKLAAINTLRAAHYDGSNYFFIWNTQGVGIAHGGNRALEGRNFIEGADAVNSPNVRDMVSKLVSVAVRQGEGFTQYKIPKAGQSVPLAKIGYAKLFSPWDWVIGTGAYDSDIDAVFWAEARTEGAIALCIVALTAALSYLLGRDLSRSLLRLTGVTAKLAEGDLGAHIPCTTRRDEIGVMAGAIEVFKNSAMRTRELEWRQANDQRSASEAAHLVVGSIGEGLERLAAGDLAFRLTTVLPPAYETLRTNLNATASQLSALVQGIVANTAALRQGSGQIANAADALTLRTRSQVTRLVRTASALDEITAAVRCTAEISNHARAVVSHTHKDAETIDAVVGIAVASMEELEASSRQVGHFVAVIDAIASQTTLLALNASIEAARAGDAGRGFEVVATEVRALALRSTDAARQIRALIEQSQRAVGKGADAVAATREAVMRIVSQVGDISGSVARIAGAGQEQSDGLGMVNEAVREMDGIAQQNAAIVTQSTAASHTLMREAETLTNLISRFRVGAAHGSAHQWRGEAAAG